MASTDIRRSLRQLSPESWELPVSYRDGMLVPGVLYATEALLAGVLEDRALEQVANVAFLPGIVGQSLAMPDIHWGYGFPIGGVAATREDTGVVSPGGVGFDINCGIRVLRTDLNEHDVRPRLHDLVERLFRAVPSGVGSSGRLKLSAREVEQVMRRGAEWAVEAGYGVPDDLAVTEENGRMAHAEPRSVGDRPRKRGAPQLGTLGSGNHFLEIQAVDTVFDQQAADVLGLGPAGQAVVMFHCGSRGFGHQVCEDYVRVCDTAMRKYGIVLPDRQLACAPVESPEGRRYLSAMRCAANFAWANRQVIAHWTRETFESVFERPWQDLGMRQVYDISHNMAKLETHQVQGAATRVCVHRKGATSALPPGHPGVPPAYRGIGQPVLIPGDMGRQSYICVGGPRSLELTFGSACHGAGRVRSRSAAKRMLKGRDIGAELAEQGIVARARGWASLAEEAPLAYKDVNEVVETCERAGLARRVVRLRPLGVVKG